MSKERDGNLFCPPRLCCMAKSARSSQERTRIEQHSSRLSHQVPIRLRCKSVFPSEHVVYSLQLQWLCGAACIGPAIEGALVPRGRGGILGRWNARAQATLHRIPFDIIFFSSSLIPPFQFLSFFLSLSLSVSRSRSRSLSPPPHLPFNRWVAI